MSTGTRTFSLCARRDRTPLTLHNSGKDARLGAKATGLCSDMMESLEQIKSRIESAVSGSEDRHRPQRQSIAAIVAFN